MKVATPSEALARSVLHGQPVIPDEVVIGGEQQSFLDARISPDSQSDGYEPSVLEVPEPIAAGKGTELPFINWGDNNEDLPPIPEDEELDNAGVTVPEITIDGEDMSDEVNDTDELIEAASSSLDRRRSSLAPRAGRNVRPRLETQPESERGSSLMPSRCESVGSADRPSAEAPQPTPPQAAGPQSWPNPYDSLNNLPASLRSHFERARNAAAQWSVEQVEQSTAMFTCFMAGKDEIVEQGKKVLKSIHFESAPPEVQKALQVSRAQEWSKFESFGAVVPLTPDQVQELAEGYQIIPSKWVDGDKVQYKKGRDPNYQPQYKSRLVSCGNFECSDGMRSDNPTADIEVHNLICCWCAAHELDLYSADVTSAYFQGRRTGYS